MKRLGSVLFVVVVLLAGATPSPAHRGSTHAVGVVTAIDARVIAIQEDSGKDHSARLTRDTIYRGYVHDGPAKWTGIKIGDRVFVDMFGMPGGQQTATEIRLLQRALESSGK